jgi:hypothetical protein
MATLKASKEEQAAAMQAPLSAQFAMDTFAGRFQYFSRICDPRHLIRSEKEIEDARTLLSRAKVKNSETEHARHVLAGTTHPSSGEIIPAPCRMGSWVLMGTVPITGLTVMSRFYPTNLLGVGLLQWCNQSVNASVNFFNGSAVAGGEEGMQVFAQGYTGACASAVGIALGFGIFLRRNANNPFLKSVGKYAPFPATALANCINTALVRQHELKEGIMVTDAAGNPMGKSKIAAKKAISETCVTRVVIPAGNFIMAPFLYHLIESRTLTLIRRPYLVIPLQVGLTMSCFFATLPTSLALYDQRGSIDLRELEPQIAQKVADRRDGGILFYHKGV